jgi:hypothetical protein
MAAKHTHGPNFGRHVDDCARCIELANGAAPVQSGWSGTRTDDAPKTTQHTHQVVFGRKVDGCPRCAELKAGAAPVRWAPSRRQQDELRAAEIRAHDCKQSGCSIVCTFGDW